jgi:hypothetical protein
MIWQILESVKIKLCQPLLCLHRAQRLRNHVYQGCQARCRPFEAAQPCTQELVHSLSSLLPVVRPVFADSPVFSPVHLLLLCWLPPSWGLVFVCCVRAKRQILSANTPMSQLSRSKWDDNNLPNESLFLIASLSTTYSSNMRSSKNQCG